jgi:hypothetical protein
MKFTKILSLGGILVLTAAIALTLVLTVGKSNTTSNYLKTSVGVDSKTNSYLSLSGFGLAPGSLTGANMPGLPTFIAESEKNALTSTANVAKTRYLLAGEFSSSVGRTSSLKVKNQYADALIADFLKRAASQEVTLTTTSSGYGCSDTYH